MRRPPVTIWTRCWLAVFLAACGPVASEAEPSVPPWDEAPTYPFVRADATEADICEYVRTWRTRVIVTRKAVEEVAETKRESAKRLHAVTVKYSAWVESTALERGVDCPATPAKP